MKATSPEVIAGVARIPPEAIEGGEQLIALTHHDRIFRDDAIAASVIESK